MLVNCEANLSVRKVKENYRQRFGIEAGYRGLKAPEINQMWSY
jgi:hypothetical protein